jgi:hypothetical protein
MGRVSRKRAGTEERREERKLPKRSGRVWGKGEEPRERTG